jgi:putative transposase
MLAARQIRYIARSGTRFMPFWQLFYHFIWAAKDRQPLITHDVEPEVYGLLRGKTIGLGGTLLAVNGVADHVHLVASVPPRIAVATFIGQVKGVTSARFNQAHDGDPGLYWQEEYGVFSLHRNVLPNFIAYVENQKQHHADGKLLNILERTDDHGVQILREPAGSYAIEYANWWTNMEQMA